MGKFHLKVIEDNKFSYAFHAFLKDVYHDDPNWVQHPIEDVEKVFNPKRNSYFSHGKCRRWIILNSDNQVIGRIAAFINEKKAFTFDQPTGGIGFFECINNQEAAFILFDTAKKWLEQSGMEAMDGPINFGENNKFWGLLIENFEFPTYYGQNYNPPYYKVFFENYGFQIYYNQIINHRVLNEKMSIDYLERAQKLSNDTNYSVEQLNRSELDKYAAMFREIYNDAWKSHEGNSEMSLKRAKAIFKSLKTILDEDLGYFVLHEGIPVGFILGIPDINPVIAKLNGRLNLIGKLKFLYLKKRIRISRINGIAIGVKSAFQGVGVEALLFQTIMTNGQVLKKYKDVVITWVGDFNPKMLHIFKQLGFTQISRMATYRKLFNKDAIFMRSPIINS